MWSLFSGSGKTITALGGIVAVIVLFVVMLDRAETAGYNKALADVKESSSKMIEKVNLDLRRKAAAETRDALDKQQLIFESEINRVIKLSKTRVKIEKVIEYVDRVEVRSDCNNLGSGVVGLLNSAITAGDIR